MNFCIQGAGAWGTAIAIHLHRNGHAVTLMPRRLEHAAALATSRENTEYLPGFRLHPDIQISCELGPSLLEAEGIVFACPSSGLRAAAARLAAVFAALEPRRHAVVISLVKGLEKGTLLLPLDVLAQEFPSCVHSVLSGPTNAAEVAADMPGAAVFATDADEEDAVRIQNVLNGTRFRVYRSADAVGVQLGGILKNIYAIGAGISDGLRLGSNAKASYLTRAIQEMVQIGTALGGKPETFHGLSGVGDLIATAHGTWSRNRNFGEELARNNAAKPHPNETAEGYAATACFHELAKKRNLSTPILDALYCVLYKGVPPLESIASLFGRVLKRERE